VLLPISAIFVILIEIRKAILKNRFSRRKNSVPVIVIGNIVVGGSGKTPLLISVVRELLRRGIKTAVVSRGYGRSGQNETIEVTSETPVCLSGDEPLLIAKSCECRVIVDSDRARAVKFLSRTGDYDLILSDDGLQHYSMNRDVEIVVIDGSRGFGNGFCIPAGPLREPIRRLRSVDFIAVNDEVEKKVYPPHVHVFHFFYKPMKIVNLLTGQVCHPDNWDGSEIVHAVTAIGAPDRFKKSLERLGLQVILHPHDDHDRLKLGDLSFNDGLDIIITAKDAVKLEWEFDHDVWCLEIEAVLDPSVTDDLITCLNEKGLNLVVQR
jgi:tetraacyldisaccharide 4'-kinase|tara:strand:+ start:6376 stop:7344 length:969 start_codon:yes stop_codon:yes gene_type:complete